MLGCPYCGHQLANARLYLGKAGRCPKCQGRYRFPATPEGDTVGLAPGGAAPAQAIPVAQLAPEPELAPAPAASPLVPLHPSAPNRRAPRRRAPKSSLMPIFIGLGIAVVLIGGGVAWVASRVHEGDRLTKFNNTLIQPSRDLEVQVKLMSEQFKLWGAGKPFDMAAIEGSCRRGLETVTSGEKALASVDVPDRATARKFYTCTQEYLSIEHALLENDIPSIIRMIKDNAPREKVMAALVVMGERSAKEEQPKVAAMLAAQQEFAREVGMQLR